MEQKINFICLTKFHSNKSNKDFFQVSYVFNHKPVTEFITEELYKKFIDLKLVEFKEYKGIFDANSNNKLVLVDIK